ncbi:hypothetical protein AKJ09_07933 [Labilithrix luteola]|uniref:Uncharacterized protein n=1 Tax=Labilithrix luteola TaxID=1391654 RepID=A0A0K1Q7A2_9BACT|nr:hypothetical protein AKJ09_07933 [Labilithrix luteola]
MHVRARRRGPRCASVVRAGRGERDEGAAGDAEERQGSKKGRPHDGAHRIAKKAQFAPVELGDVDEASAGKRLQNRRTGASCSALSDDATHKRQRREGTLVPCRGAGESST